MDIDYANSVIKQCIEGRKRWGNMYDTGSFSVQTIIDAVIVISKAESWEVGNLKRELTASNRRLGASKARESKLKKRIEQLESLTSVQSKAG